MTARRQAPCPPPRAWRCRDATASGQAAATARRSTPGPTLDDPRRTPLSSRGGTAPTNPLPWCSQKGLARPREVERHAGAVGSDPPLRRPDRARRPVVHHRRRADVRVRQPQRCRQDHRQRIILGMLAPTPARSAGAASPVADRSDRVRAKRPVGCGHVLTQLTNGLGAGTTVETADWARTNCSAPRSGGVPSGKMRSNPGTRLARRVISSRVQRLRTSSRPARSRQRLLVQHIEAHLDHLARRLRTRASSALESSVRETP